MNTIFSPWLRQQLQGSDEKGVYKDAEEGREIFSVSSASFL